MPLVNVRVLPRPRALPLPVAETLLVAEHILLLRVPLVAEHYGSTARVFLRRRLLNVLVLASTVCSWADIIGGYMGNKGFEYLLDVSAYIALSRAPPSF